MEMLFYNALLVFFEFLRFCIALRILLSLIGFNNKNIITSFLYSITEPILSLGRKILEIIKIDTGIFDFSPIIAIFLMQIIEVILRRIIF